METEPLKQGNKWEDLPRGLAVTNSPANSGGVGATGSIPGSAKGWTQLSDLTTKTINAKQINKSEPNMTHIFKGRKD